jgi:hypothetical protein
VDDEIQMRTPSVSRPCLPGDRHYAAHIFISMALALSTMLTLVCASSRPALAQSEICGDLDGSGAITASDALLLLRRAVGAGGDISCPQCGPTTTVAPTTTTTVGPTTTTILAPTTTTTVAPTTTTTVLGCASLGGSCVVDTDCCEVFPPPLTAGGAGTVLPSCCDGHCTIFGYCVGSGSPCVCGAHCCSGSCGESVPGQCD